MRGSWLVFIRVNGRNLAVEEEILKADPSLGQFTRPGVEVCSLGKSQTTDNKIVPAEKQLNGDRLHY